VQRTAIRSASPKLKAGTVPIYEPHLENMLLATCRAKRLSFTDDAGEAVRAGDIIFICVGTPPLETGRSGPVSN